MRACDHKLGGDGAAEIGRAAGPACVWRWSGE
jgi:hypothetical protein